MLNMPGPNNQDFHHLANINISATSFTFLFDLFLKPLAVFMPYIGLLVVPLFLQTDKKEINPS